MSIFQNNLRKYRENQGITAKDFAAQIGIPYTTYVSYEKGVWPSEENLVKIAATLNVSIDELLGYPASDSVWQKISRLLDGRTRKEITDIFQRILSSFDNCKYKHKEGDSNDKRGIFKSRTGKSKSKGHT